MAGLPTFKHLLSQTLGGGPTLEVVALLLAAALIGIAAMIAYPLLGLAAAFALALFVVSAAVHGRKGHRPVPPVPARVPIDRRVALREAWRDLNDIERGTGRPPTPQRR
jgi:hypothetical protein